MESLGLGRGEEKVYRALLRAPRTDLAAIAKATEMPPERVKADLARLMEFRLAEVNGGSPETYTPTPPDITIMALLNERQADLDQARLAVPELMSEYQRGTSITNPESLVEVCTGPEVGLRRFRELLAAATEEVLSFDRVSDLNATGEAEVAAQAPVLRRGVRCRSIYEVASLSLPGRLPHIRALAALGEQSRVARRLPMKMIICDRRLAMLPLSFTPEDRTESVMLIESSTLLDALVDLFEAYWQRSTPVSASPKRSANPVDLPPEELEVLRLLNIGLKDESIARQLGVSMRTTRRRIASLLDRLGVTTRFQAGIAAAKRGLL